MPGKSRPDSSRAAVVTSRTPGITNLQRGWMSLASDDPISSARTLRGKNQVKTTARRSAVTGRPRVPTVSSMKSRTLIPAKFNSAAL